MYLKEKKSLINLYDYTTPNTNVTENKNQFLATDFRYSFGKRWDIKAFVLANKNWIRSQSDQSIEYLQENEIVDLLGGVNDLNNKIREFENDEKGERKDDDIAVLNKKVEKCK